MDRSVESAGRRPRRWMETGLLGGLTISLVILVVYGAQTLRFGGEAPPPWTVSEWSAAAIALALVIPAHEAGHLVFGLAAGLRFSLFAVGPLMVHRDGDRTRIRLHRHFGIYGGVASCLPRDENRVLERFTWMVAGGPLTSLVLAVAGILGGSAVGSSSSVGSAFLSMLGCGSFGIFLAVTIPRTTGPFLSDRGRLTVILRGGPEAARLSANMALQARMQAGERPRTWPTHLVAESIRPADGTLDELVGRQTAALPHALDVSRPEEALQHVRYLVERLESWPAFLRPSVLFDAAFVEAMYGEGSKKAQLLLDQAQKTTFVDAPLRLRTLAAVARAAGDPDRARRLAQDGLQILDKSFLAGMGPLLRDQLQALAETPSSLLGDDPDAK